MNSRMLSGLLIIGTIVLGLWLVWPNRQPMPAVTFNLLDGRKLTSEALRGRPVLVNFWSLNCAVCIDDMPSLARLHETLKDRQLMVIGVAMSHDPPPAVIALAEQRQLPYPIALDVHGELKQAFGGVDATPTNFLIAPDGSIRYAAQGPLDEVRIRATITTF